MEMNLYFFRKKYETKIDTIEVKIHFVVLYTFQNGVLHMNTDEIPYVTLELTLDVSF